MKKNTKYVCRCYNYNIKYVWGWELEHPSYMEAFCKSCMRNIVRNMDSQVVLKHFIGIYIMTEMHTEDQIKFEQRCNQDVLDLYVVKTSNMVHHESDIKIINNLLEDLYLSRYIMKKHNYVFTKKTLKMIKQLSCVFENYYRVTNMQR